MKNSPNKSPETSNESLFKTYRTRIILILFAFTLGILCGRGCEDEAEAKDSDENNKPKPADTSGNGESYEGDERENKRSTMFVERGDPEFCEQLTNEEYKIRADEIRLDKAKEMVDRVLEILCIDNPNDQEAIYQAISNGYTTIDDFNASWEKDKYSVRLSKPISASWKQTDGQEIITLTEPPSCEWPKDVGETDGIYNVIQDDLEAGRYSKALRGVVDEDQIRKDAELLGIDDEEVERYIEIIDEFESEIDSAKTREELQVATCKIFSRISESLSSSSNTSFYHKYSPINFVNFLEIIAIYIFDVEFPDCTEIMLNNQ